MLLSLSQSETNAPYRADSPQWVTHASPLVPELPHLAFAPPADSLVIGHIGSLYEGNPFRQFLRACQSIAAQTNKRLRVVRVGLDQSWIRLPPNTLPFLTAKANSTRKRLYRCLVRATFFMPCIHKEAASRAFAVPFR